MQLQITVTLDDQAMRALSAMVEQSVRRASAPSPEELQREARIRQSRNALFAGQKPPEGMELLIDSRQVAKLLKVSDRTIFQMRKEGRMPDAIKIGSAVRWDANKVKKWVEEGCPAQTSQ